MLSYFLHHFHWEFVWLVISFIILGFCSIITLHDMFFSKAGKWIKKDSQFELIFVIFFMFYFIVALYAACWCCDYYEPLQKIADGYNIYIDGEQVYCSGADAMAVAKEWTILDNDRAVIISTQDDVISGIVTNGLD